MATRHLSLAQLQHLDMGLLEATFDRELAVVNADILDRDKLKKPRKLVLTLEFVPGNTDGRVAVKGKVASVLPPRETEFYHMTQVGEDGLVFNAAAPEDPDQRTLDELQEKGDDEV